MKTLYIDKERFLKWYFSDKHDYENLAERVVEGLSDYGEYNISVEDLIEECWDINSSYIKNWDITGYPSDIYIEEGIQEGVIPKSFSDEYEVKLEVEE